VRLTPRGRFIDYRWSVVLLALGAIGCSDGSTALNHVRDLAIAGQLTIRSRAYAMDWIDIRVDGRVDSVGWSSTGDDVFGSASLTAVLADDPVFKADAARIGAGVHELSAIVQPSIGTIDPRADFPFLRQASITAPTPRMSQSWTV
jgi:hypothetical protein